MTDNVTFGVLQEDGTLADMRLIPQARIMACPHVIIDAGHYRQDGTCRCDDPGAAEMAEYGYVWKDGAWR